MDLSDTSSTLFTFNLEDHYYDEDYLLVLFILIIPLSVHSPRGKLAKN